MDNGGAFNSHARERAKDPGPNPSQKTWQCPVPMPKPQCSVKTELAVQPGHKNYLKSLQESSVQCSETPARLMKKWEANGREGKKTGFPKRDLNAESVHSSIAMSKLSCVAMTEKCFRRLPKRYSKVTTGAQEVRPCNNAKVCCHSELPSLCTIKAASS